MSILAIDPGTVQSAWVELGPFGRVVSHGIVPNDGVLVALRTKRLIADRVVIERIESYGMPVGREVFDTVLWAGRFAEAAHNLPVFLLPRRAVKLHLCGNARANDANIRAALLDRFGGRTAAVGLKRTPGPLYGIHGDVWAALAVAVTFHDEPDLAEVLR